MNREKQIVEMAFTDVDILANDINQHCADLAENYCGDTHCVACLAHALTEKGYRKSSDVAEEIFAEIERFLVEKLSSINAFRKKGDSFYDGEIHALELLLYKNAELRKKYTESEKDNDT